MDAYARRKLVAGIFLIIFFLILLIGEAMRDQTLRRWALAWVGMLCGGLGAIAVLLYLLLSPALAHDHMRPELNDWFMGLHSKGHAPCCDGSEAIHLADVDWDTKDGHYRVRLEDQWVDVPDDAVIDEPNRDGRTLVWPYSYSSDGSIHIRCFLPGAGS